MKIDGPAETHKQVNRFYDVKEHFVLAVFDVFGSPRDCVGDGHRRPHCSDVQLVALLRDVPVRSKATIERANPIDAG